MRKIRSTVVLALVLAGLVAGVVPAIIAPAALAAAPTVPARYMSQRIDWKPCFHGAPPKGLPAGSERLECASFSTPRDWNAPEAKTDITIAVSRLRPASGTAKGSLLTNPGGPGAPGRTLPLLLLEGHRSKVLDNLEVIGIDVRGTGNSTDITCDDQATTGAALDPRDRDPANTGLILDAVQYVAKACQHGAGELGPLVNTEQTVRDLDLLRQLLGRDKVDWLGFSGGTWLGAHYATYFPTHVGHFALDANTEFTAPWQATFHRQPLGFQRRYESQFLPYAASYDGVFHLGSTAAQVNAVYEDARASLAAHPLELTRGLAVHATDLDTFVAEAMYSKASFQGLAEGLGQLRDLLAGGTGGGAARAGSPLASALRQASTLRLRGGMLPLAPDAQEATFLAVICNDTPWTGNRESLLRDSEQQGRAYPLLGWASFETPCVFWNRPHLTMPTPDGRGVPPVLMVQSDLDPATPFEGALAAHRAFTGSRLLTVNNEGDHTTYGRNNGCVNAAVESFLVDGVLPPGDFACPGVPIPSPKSSGAATREAPKADGSPQERVANFTMLAGPMPR